MREMGQWQQYTKYWRSRRWTATRLLIGLNLFISLLLFYAMAFHGDCYHAENNLNHVVQKLQMLN